VKVCETYSITENPTESSNYEMYIWPTHTHTECKTDKHRTKVYLTFQDTDGPYMKTLLYFLTYFDKLYICGFMRHVQVQPVCSIAVAVQTVQRCVWHSKHTGRHLCRTLQLTEWVANMDYRMVKFKDIHQMAETHKWMCAVKVLYVYQLASYILNRKVVNDKYAKTRTSSHCH
jgi:hypothetical protein